MEKTEITVIGAGVVGLAVASEFSKSSKNIILLEKNDKFGQETSSRNSEVIHAGIYYQKNSLKSKLCVEGKILLYEFLKKHSLPYKKCGKFIVAVESEETKQLEILIQQAEKNDVSNLRHITQKELKNLIPDVRAENALFSPSTGILDTHQYMQKLESICMENNVLISYNSEVINIEKINENYKITTKESSGNKFEFLSEIIINCAGLQCEKIAYMAGINTTPEYRIYYAKGEYFNLPGKYKNLYSSLIYPTVPLGSTSLGIHTVIDLQGMLKLGPNIFYIDDIDYDVDISHKKEFYSAAKKYLPFIQEDELSPDMSGIRPKRQGPDDGFKDFMMKEETDKGFPGFINLIGMESPALTASLAIAKYVKQLI